MLNRCVKRVCRSLVFMYLVHTPKARRGNGAILMSVLFLGVLRMLGKHCDIYSKGSSRMATPISQPLSRLVLAPEILEKDQA